MHDLHLAQKIIKVIITEATNKAQKKVVLAKIGLGKIIEHNEQILPENLTYNLSMLAKETIAEGARFEIYEIEGNSYIINEIETE